MTSKKVLFISQVIEPYVPETPMSRLGKVIPQSIQDMGNEIRTFQPKWGNINERRNQLHEVIRLSGLNVIIDDTDHPLLIKVASLQSAHIQVYFIDSEDFFNKRLAEGDSKTKEYDDNYERSIFYTRSVIETIKKQRWYPDVIHCQGWISGTAPFFIRAAYQDELPFEQNYYICPSGNADTPHAVAAWFVQRSQWPVLKERGLPDYLQIQEEKLLFFEQ